MEFTVDNLNASGAFSGAPVAKKVTWRVGDVSHTADVYVRRLSYYSAVSEVGAWRSKKDGMAARIASCIVDNAGKPVLTIDDITGDADPERGPLNADLTMALMGVIGEVNDLGKSKS